MNNKSITPNPQQPVDRVPTGQLPSALAELSEAALSAEGVLPAFRNPSFCSTQLDMILDMQQKLGACKRG